MAASVLPFSPAPHAETPALVRLDERIGNAQPGVICVQTASNVCDALIRHLERRLGVSTLVAFVTSSTPAVVQLAQSLGIEDVNKDPASLAQMLSARCRGRRVIVSGVSEGTFDAAVLQELDTSRMLLILVGESVNVFGGEAFVVADALAESERSLWMQALGAELPAEPGLSSLNHFWERARFALPVDALTAEANTALHSLSSWGAPCSYEEGVLRFGKSSVEELLRSSNLVCLGGRLFVRNVSEDGAAYDQSHVVDALCGQSDPWSKAQAAILVLRKEPVRAQGLIEEAFAAHPLVVRELAERWFRALEEAAPGVECWIRSGERMLECGEPNLAKRAFQRALEQESSVAALLGCGRSFIAAGDLVGGAELLKKANERATTAVEKAAVVAEEAELAYVDGKIRVAEEACASVLASCQDFETRMRVRNVLGKVLLFESKWDEADAHFASDAIEAAEVSNVTAELRAITNRAIARLSAGAIEEAKSMFTHVLAQGEQVKLPMACAFAMWNLAVIAVRQRQYKRAIDLWERASTFRNIARTDIRSLQNLAALRLKLGFVQQAEHTLAFAVRATDSLPSPIRAELHHRLACVALAKNDTALARTYVARALSDASTGRKGAEIRAMSARIALEDGDLQRAQSEIAQARELGCDDLTGATLLLLEAMLLRGRGETAELPGVIADAIEAATRVEDDELIVEALVLGAELSLAIGESDVAREQLKRACRVRDAVAQSLEGELRASYLAKSLNAALARLSYALEREAALPESVQLRVTEIAQSHVRELVGDSTGMQALRRTIAKVAASDAIVLIRGESGTGKELVADAIHRQSKRNKGPLVSVNCAALAEDLLLSELFGHEKGAFTGAAGRRRGRFELAEGGTLFLDEIGDISAKTQVALLRVLQEKTFERVGGAEPIRANVRVVCATHRDLRGMVQRGEFREDLYYRLRGIVLEVPALRQRVGDLPQIAEHLLRRISNERKEPAKTLSRDALDLLCRHRWSGNVRELENVLRTASLFADGDVISALDLVSNIDEMAEVAQQAPVSRSVLPPPISTADVERNEEEDETLPLPDGEATATSIAYGQIRQGSVSLSDMKRQIERDCIARALDETGGNITKAATLLGMKRPRLSQLVKQYGLSVASEVL